MAIGDLSHTPPSPLVLSPFSRNRNANHHERYAQFAPRGWANTKKVDLAYFYCVAVGDTSDGYRGCTEYYHARLLRELGTKDGAPGGGADRDRASAPTLDELGESIDLAMCDFQRFLCGWGRWGSDISSVALRVLNRLDGGKILASEDAYREAMVREYG